MPTIKLTKRDIERALREGVSVRLWDSELRGFGVRISSKGKASWIVRRRLGAGGRGAKETWG